MARVVAILAIATFLVGFALDASAGPVAPSKPSQMVTLLASPGPPACPNTSFSQVVTVLKPEGGTAPFVIPNKSVFIVTDFAWTAGSLTAGHFASMGLFGSGPNGEVGPATFSAGAVGTNGEAFGTANLTTGMVVKPPSLLCANFPSANGSAVVHGFFAKDK